MFKTAFRSIYFERIDGLDNVLCCSKFTNHSFQSVNNKGASKPVPMRRLVYAFVVHLQLSQVFSRYGLNRPLKQSFKDYEIN